MSPLIMPIFVYYTSLFFVPVTLVMAAVHAAGENWVMFVAMALLSASFFLQAVNTGHF